MVYYNQKETKPEAVGSEGQASRGSDNLTKMSFFRKSLFHPTKKNKKNLKKQLTKPKKVV